jgi:hypothetical protein
MFGLELAVMQTIAIYAAEKAYIDSLKNEEKKLYLENKAKEYEAKKKHKEALEIANALRPRNFWGK